MTDKWSYAVTARQDLLVAGVARIARVLMTEPEHVPQLIAGHSGQRQRLGRRQRRGVVNSSRASLTESERNERARYERPLTFLMSKPRSGWSGWQMSVLHSHTNRCPYCSQSLAAASTAAVTAARASRTPSRRCSTSAVAVAASATPNRGARAPDGQRLAHRPIGIPGAATRSPSTTSYPVSSSNVPPSSMRASATPHAS